MFAFAPPSALSPLQVARVAGEVSATLTNAFVLPAVVGGPHRLIGRAVATILTFPAQRANVMAKAGNSGA
jgi:hypothetical protein